MYSCMSQYSSYIDVGHYVMGGVVCRLQSHHHAQEKFLFFYSDSYIDNSSDQSSLYAIGNL